MKNIICFFSQKQFGKDSAADHLVKMKGDTWKRTAFADEIKDSFCELFGVTREFIEEWKEKPDVPEGFNVACRSALQFIGDGFRGIKDDVWICHALKLAEKHNIIISDGRYLNELYKVKECGGTNVLIYRPDYINNIDHPSESEVGSIVKWFANNYIPEGRFDLNGRDCNVKGVSFIDFYLVNDGSLEDWQNKVDEHLTNV